jgi:hypothetical protein
MHFALVINVNLCMMSNTPPPLNRGTNRFRPKITLNALIYNVL